MAAEWTDRDRIAGNFATFSRLAAVIDLDGQDPEYLRAMAFWLERWAEGSAKPTLSRELRRLAGSRRT